MGHLAYGITAFLISKLMFIEHKVTDTKKKKKKHKTALCSHLMFYSWPCLSRLGGGWSKGCGGLWGRQAGIGHSVASAPASPWCN